MNKDYCNLTPTQEAVVLHMMSTRECQLMLWPEEFTYNELIDLEKRGIIYHKFDGPNTYASTSWYLNQ